MKLHEAANFLYTGKIDPKDQQVEIYLFEKCIYNGSLLEIPEKLKEHRLSLLFDHGTEENRVIKIFLGYIFTDL